MILARVEYHISISHILLVYYTYTIAAALLKVAIACHR